MAFAVDMPAAARRHLLAADQLSSGHRRDVAGYLYGVAAECAVKSMMVESGYRQKLQGARREDPMFAHFPELRTMLRDMLKGRRGQPLIRLIANDSFMAQWSTKMRYSHGKDISVEWVEAWSKQARQAVNCIGS